MAGEKSPIPTYTNTVGTGEVCQFLAIGYLGYILYGLHFYNNTPQTLQVFPGELFRGFDEGFRIFNFHTPSQFSKSAFSSSFAFSFPSGTFSTSQAYCWFSSYVSATLSKILSINFFRLVPRFAAITESERNVFPLMSIIFFLGCTVVVDISLIILIRCKYI